MKRFLIPAFFVIDAETQTEAEELSARMQEIANDGIQGTGTFFLMQDEELPTREVPIIAGETELPHTYNWQFEVDTEQADEPTCSCGSRIFNEKGDCQICGL